LIRVVPKHVLEGNTQVILENFGQFFREHPEVEVITMDNFKTWFHLKHPKDDENKRAAIDTMLNLVTGTPDPSAEAGILERLLAAKASADVMSIVEKFNDGEDIDLYSALRGTVEWMETQTAKKIRVPWVQDSIHDILNEDRNDAGLHWRLDALNTSLRPLRGGDFGIVAARPDRGKTTFTASEVTFMAAQFDAYYGVDHGRHVVWFNNEGPGKRIKARCYQAALGKTTRELVEMDRETLDAAYAKAIGADDRIRIMDVHDFYSYEVEDILKRVKPGLVIFDMIDNIKFGGEVGNGGQRTDQLLEAMYQWARVLGVKFDTPVLAMSQISADGDGLQYPTLPMLKDSKTGKQGAADFIVTLGAVNEPMYESSRWIGATKNKLAKEGAPKSPCAEVQFDGQRARVTMPGG